MKRDGFVERVAFALTFFGAIFVVLILVLMFVVLLYASLDAIEHFGVFRFVFSVKWDPSKSIFGGAGPIYGTVITTIIALIIAVPVSLGIAVFISQLCPEFLKDIFSYSIEMLATIPSIVYGMWGLFSLAPIMRNYIEPFLQRVFLPIPGLRLLFEGTPLGIDLLTSGVVLSIMIIPFIGSIARDNFELVPKELIESAYAMGQPGGRL